MTTKQPTLRLPLSDDLLEWIETQAQDLGCDPATWIRMQLVAMRKGAKGVVSVPSVFRAVPVPTHPEPRQGDQAGNPDDLVPLPQDDWRGPVEEEPSNAAPEAIETLVQRSLESHQGVVSHVLPPTEMFAKSPGEASHANGATRALSVPPRRFANNPPGL